MARDLEQITLAYWKVRMAVHHPTYREDMTNEEAFELLRMQDYLRPTDCRLKHSMHEISYDIVEGNTEWREQRRMAGSVSTLPTRK